MGAYLGGVIDRPRVKDRLDGYLSGEDWRDSPYLTAYIFAAMLQKPGRIPVEWANAGRSVAQDLNQPQYLRELAFNVMGKSPNPADMAWLRRQAVAVQSDNDARAIAVAIARGGRLDPALSARISARSPQLKHTVDYLAGEGQTAIPCSLEGLGQDPLGPKVHEAVTAMFSLVGSPGSVASLEMFSAVTQRMLGSDCDLRRRNSSS